MKFAEIRKAVMAAVGAVAQVVALGVLHGQLLHIAQAILSVATIAGVYGVRNAGPIPEVPPASVRPSGGRACNGNCPLCKERAAKAAG